MKMLMILNDPPYGTERCYNGLRIARALVKKDVEATVFLMADAVVCAKQGQKVPSGYYNIGVMLGAVLRKGHVLVCGTCMDARGLSDQDLLEGARRSSMEELAENIVTADKVLVY